MALAYFGKGTEVQPASKKQPTKKNNIEFFNDFIIKTLPFRDKIKLIISVMPTIIAGRGIMYVNYHFKKQLKEEKYDEMDLICDEYGAKYGATKSPADVLLKNYY